MNAIEIYAWPLTVAIIIFELGLTLSLFIPFVEWPPFFRKIRNTHLLIGTLTGLVAQYFYAGFNFAESVVIFALWMTFSIFLAVDMTYDVFLAF